MTHELAVCFLLTASSPGGQGASVFVANEAELLQVLLHRDGKGAGRDRQAARHLRVCSPGCISFYVS